MTHACLTDLLHVLCEHDITVLSFRRRADVVSVISASSLPVEGVSVCQIFDLEHLHEILCVTSGRLVQGCMDTLFVFQFSTDSLSNSNSTYNFTVMVEGTEQRETFPFNSINPSVTHRTPD